MSWLPCEPSLPCPLELGLTIGTSTEAFEPATLVSSSSASALISRLFFAGNSSAFISRHFFAGNSSAFISRHYFTGALPVLLAGADRGVVVDLAVSSSGALLVLLAGADRGVVADLVAVVHFSAR